ncbi:WD40 repeat domain-containing serine/threonine protein kinase [Frankia sp. QA3]|uniref:WD40 repeat domain-containing serine/threonine protein kinase n=1 Tax=Frankia sp. QA3 TaxID=710111 RepID=UPI000269D09F|nr:serine/threonine-protein kinase [Frankia sp. QA3]EIV95427.1 WD40 repeat-containing protein [Frankia sp. QA3]
MVRDTAVGRVIASRYRLIRRLGGGSMGSVWEAVDEILDVSVALKQINMLGGQSAAEQDELVARAQREARSAARLRGHPHIVTVHDVVEDQHLPWIVLELIDGRSLADALRHDGPLDPARATQVGLAVLDALTFAEGKGIVHRDVKPANILLTASGTAKLADFGIATLQGATTITKNGHAPMTLAYAAPERLRGAAGTIASDIFSLGVTLYEAVEGISPFLRQDIPATVYAILDADPPPPRHAPPPLADTLRRMLVKDPATRADAGQVRAGLASIGRTDPPGNTRLPRRVERRHRLWRPFGAPLTGCAGEVLSVAFSPHSTTLASGDRWTVRLWDLADPAAPRLLGGPLTGHNSWVNAVTFAPDGRTLASASSDRTVRLWDVANPAAPRPLGSPLTGHTSTVNAVTFAPDSTLLASSGDDKTVRLWDVSDPAIPRPLGKPLHGHTGWVHALAFAPHGRILASADYEGTVRLWDVTHPATPRFLAEPLTRTSWVHAVAFTPDGTILASASGDTTVRLWDVADPAAPCPLGSPLTGHTSGVQAVAFTPDGTILASASHDQTVRLWDLADPATPRPLGKPLTGHTDTAYSVAFAPNSTLLASAGDRTIRLWTQ